MPSSLRRSSSEPSLTAIGPVRRFITTTTTAIFRASLRRRRHPPRATSTPTPPPDNPQLSESSNIHPNLPVLFEGADLPFARRNHNLRLKFIEYSPQSGSVERKLTRQEILAEVRTISSTRDRRAALVPAPSSHLRRMRTSSRSNASSPPRRRRGAPQARGRGTPSTPYFANSASADSPSPFPTPLPTPPPPTPPPTPGMEPRRPTGNRLTVRDMRQIDPSFTAKPAIWVREEALVVSLESVRAIILCDRMFIFDPDNDKVKKSLWHIKKRLGPGIEDVFLPFEFRALEGILIHACIVLEHDFTDIEPQLRSTLGDLPRRISNEQLEKLRQLEQRLNQFYSRARKVQHAIQVVLDEDEDMADMYLTEKRKNPGLDRNPMDHDEAEMLLETYLQMVDDLTSKAGLLNQAIDDSENLIEIHLDTMQNRVLLVDLIITAISTTLSFGTMMTGIFGMNLPLPDAMGNLPSSHYYFWGCLVVVFSIMGVGLTILTRWCRRQGLYAGRREVLARRPDKNAAVMDATEEAKRKAERVLSSRSSKTYGRRGLGGSRDRGAEW